MQSDPSQAIIVTVMPATPAPERSVGDVIVGSLGIAGALLILAFVLGIGFAAIRYAWHRRYPPDDDHMPPVSPYAGR